MQSSRDFLHILKPVLLLTEAAVAVVGLVVGHGTTETIKPLHLARTRRLEIGLLIRLVHGRDTMETLLLIEGSFIARLSLIVSKLIVITCTRNFPLCFTGCDQSDS